MHPFICLFPILTGVLNRFRGGGFGGGWIRNKTGIHPRIIVSCAIALLCLVLFPWQVSCAVGLSYLIYVSKGWNRFYSFNHVSRDTYGPPDYFERFIEFISDFDGKRRDWLAFGLRNSIMAMPGVILIYIAAGVTVSFFVLLQAVGFGFAVTLLYGIGWKLFDTSPTIQNLCKVENGAIPICEILTGFFIGLLIAGGRYV